MQPMKRQAIPNGDALRPIPADLSFAAVIDIRNVEQEITDFMVRRACEEMDSAQQFPFTGRKPKQRRRGA